MKSKPFSIRFDVEVLDALKGPGCASANHVDRRDCRRCVAAAGHRAAVASTAAVHGSVMLWRPLMRGAWRKV